MARQEESSAACAAVVCRHVREYLAAGSAGNFARSALQPALAYVAAVPLPFISAVIPHHVRWPQALPAVHAPAGVHFVAVPHTADTQLDMDMTTISPSFCGLQVQDTTLPTRVNTRHVTLHSLPTQPCGVVNRENAQQQMERQLCMQR